MQKISLDPWISGASPTCYLQQLSVAPVACFDAPQPLEAGELGRVVVDVEDGDGDVGGGAHLQRRVRVDGEHGEPVLGDGLTVQVAGHPDRPVVPRDREGEGGVGEAVGYLKTEDLMLRFIGFIRISASTRGGKNGLANYPSNLLSCEF